MNDYEFTDCLFKVQRKATKQIERVYAVKTDKFVEFLIYINDEWKFFPCQLFEPIDWPRYKLRF